MSFSSGSDSFFSKLDVVRVLLDTLRQRVMAALR